MKLKSNDRVAVHQGYGYISIGKFVGVESVAGMGHCFIIRVKPEDDEGCNLGGDIMIPIQDFKHEKGEFILRKCGYKDWLEKLREKVTKETLYHKWNTNFPKNKNYKQTA